MLRWGPVALTLLSTMLTFGAVANGGQSTEGRLAVQRVEVRVDGGRWQDAQLAADVNKNSWRMWRTFFDLRSGNHTVESRATDDTGYVQTQDSADTIPDGASGWPSVAFTVD